jgi:hypothetical protein
VAHVIERIYAPEESNMYSCIRMQSKLAIIHDVDNYIVAFNLRLHMVGTPGHGDWLTELLPTGPILCCAARVKQH